MNACDLFKHVYKDLEKIDSRASEYEMLRAATLLRQLLLDGAPLIHIANERFKLSIHFPVCGIEYVKTVFELNPDNYHALDSIHASTRISGDGPKLLNLSEFLSTPVLITNGSIQTIEIVIKHAAIILGSVHFGIPKYNEQLEPAYTNGDITSFGLSINAQQLKPIVRVTLDGLRPLYSTLCLHELRVFIDEDGQRKPFSLVITNPTKSADTDDYFCSIHAPDLFRNDKSIHGVNAQQASELAIKFAKNLLSCKQLIDIDGNPVIL